MPTRTIFPETTVTGPGVSAITTGYDESTVLSIQVNVIAGPPSGGSITLQDSLDGINFDDIGGAGAATGVGPTRVRRDVSLFNGIYFGPMLRVRWNQAPTESTTFSVIVTDKLLSSPVSTVRTR